MLTQWGSTGVRVLVGGHWVYIIIWYVNYLLWWQWCHGLVLAVLVGAQVVQHFPWPQAGVVAGGAVVWQEVVGFDLLIA